MAVPDRNSADALPTPGRPVRGSHSGRPIMALLDLLGRRWALRVMWELRGGQRLPFRELQRRCGEMSSSVLSQRLRELREADILTSARGGYALTDEGAVLLEAFAGLDAWAGRWAQRVSSRASA